MYKKYLLLTVFIMLGILTLVAQTGGFTGPSLVVITVEQAKELPDETPVVLQGKITKSLGDDDYTFEDETGTIRIEIDDDVWKGVFVDENDLVEIRGEIDKEFLRVRISVDSIKKLNQE